MGQHRALESDSVVTESESNAMKQTDEACILGSKDIKRHKCTFAGCDAAFVRPSRLARHIRLHTGEKNYKCNHAGCDKAYTNSSHLKRHMETHNIQKKLYECPECQLCLSTKHNLKRHYNIMHSNCSKLTCKMCNQTFNKKYQLATHMSEHTGELHKCDKCNKCFVNFTKFTRHKMGHEVTKSYACTVPNCTKVFGKWLQLRAHMKMHTYKCKDCGKEFSRSYFKSHCKTHLEDRPILPCPYDGCNRVYHFKNNLEYHIKVKHLEQKFECDICKTKVSSKARVADHIHRIHISERKPRTKKLQRKKRKDAGVCKKSAISALLGVHLPSQVEKEIMERQENIPYMEQFELQPNDY